MISLFFSLICSSSRGIYESNIIYIGENNITEVLSDKAACLVFVNYEKDPDEKFHALSDFISAGNTISTRCFFGIMDGTKNYKFTKSNNIKEERTFFFYRYGILISKFSGKPSTEN